MRQEYYCYLDLKLRVAFYTTLGGTPEHGNLGRAVNIDM